MTEAAVKEIVQDFVLVTFDIPAKAAALRRHFLKKAHEIGAVCHTDSVYLMPYSVQAQALANELESAGHAVIWRAHQPDQEKAIEIMAKYETAVKIRCQLIEQRLALANEYIAAGRLKLAQNMGAKTGKLLYQLAQIAENWDAPWLKPRLEKLVKDWKAVYSFGEDKG
ncbi:MAG: hypothetical protein U1B77_04540 [Dehalococcoidales bacterium]|nr:hypothetical protein [Dehalococcoidales bacterium]